MSVTEKGNLCQNWTSGGKGTAYEDLNEPNNFCRNPAPMRASRVWCYVKGEDGVKKLEFCPVPSCKDVPLSAKDLEHFLSRTKCPKNLDIQNQEEDEEGSKPKHKLPVIDLFLNPTREEELKQMNQMLEEQQGNATFTEVSIHKEITIHFSFKLFITGGSLSDLPKPVPTSLAFNASLLPQTQQSERGPHAPPVRMAGQVGQLLRHLHPGCHGLWNLLCLQCQEHPGGVQLQQACV